MVTSNISKAVQLKDINRNRIFPWTMCSKIQDSRLRGKPCQINKLEYLININNRVQIEWLKLCKTRIAEMRHMNNRQGHMTKRPNLATLIIIETSSIKRDSKSSNMTKLLIMMISLLVMTTIPTKTIIMVPIMPQLVSLISPRRQKWRRVSQHNQETISDQMEKLSNLLLHRQNRQQ